MPIKRKIFTVGGHCDYSNWMEAQEVSTMEKSDLVLFTGGEDVSPSLYGEKPHKFNGYNARRDAFEVPEFKKAIKLNKKIIGICRGAQLACAMAGGKLVQHQGNPEVYHRIQTPDNKRLLVSSLHHQAQYPWPMSKDRYKILGYSIGQNDFHLDAKDKEMVQGVVENDIEVEDVFYPEIKAFGIQSHPEMLFRGYGYSKMFQDTVAHYRELLDKLMDNKL